ncbi:perilipin-3-like isoform X3 [Lacerta agilis]|uniref:perilipin-3-like isoform X3 n=1 Tax=Lacerta agilis TaxID=80427 RepID=UPI001419C9FA|nr:perilipin-3-like isoform X3 [Lacerta agilis]
MASENKDMAASDSKNNEDQQNLVSRVASVSLSAACEMVSTTYSSIKENIPVFKTFCDAAETGMRTIASAAVSGVQPLFSKPQTAVVQDSRDLDKVEEKESIAQGPDDQGSPDKKETASSTETVAAAAVCQAAAETKDVAPGMLDLVKEAVRGSVEMTTSALTSGMNTVMGSSIGQMASSAVEAVMGKSEEMVDHYLPMSDEELATLAAALEEPEASSIEKQRQQRSYYVRLGSLSNKVRQRAYQHTLGKLRQTKQKMQETLSQLQQAMDLIAYARHTDQKDQDGQEELRQKWLEWSKNQLGQSDSTGENPAEMESQALGMSRNIAQQMQAACQSLLANMQGLPAALQEKVQQAYSYMEELQAAFSSAKSFQELPSGLLTQRQETMGKIWQAGDEVLEYVMQSTPLNWIVGPFSPEEVSPPEPLAESQAAEVPPSVKESEVDVQRMEVPGSSALNDQA